ncbi:MAG: hypothetical protein WC490_06480 [Candidatus Margulisiibacteriota bacterium]
MGKNKNPEIGATLAIKSRVNIFMDINTKARINIVQTKSRREIPSILITKTRYSGGINIAKLWRNIDQYIESAYVIESVCL